MAAPQRIIEISLGKEALRFDEDLLTNKQIRQFRLDIAKEVESYDNDMGKIQEDFQALVSKFQEESAKKDKEADKAYEKRLKELTDEFTAASEKLRPPEDTYWLQDLAFRLLKVVGRLQGQEHKVTKENFDDAPANPIKEKLAYLLIKHGCEAGTLFLPPKLSDES